MAAEEAGVSLSCIYRLRRVEAGFTGTMQAAVAAADGRLSKPAEPGGGDKHLDSPSPNFSPEGERDLEDGSSSGAAADLPCQTSFRWNDGWGNV